MYRTIAPVTSLRNINQETLKTPFPTTVRPSPKFFKAQVVRFVGGIGIVKSYHLDSSTWLYVIEMDQGREPHFGRVGDETTILLCEGDILEVIQ